MALESFYGGRPGITPVIKGQFATITEMDAAFAQGDSYTKIWYNELCLIDPKNKNNADNGKLFRRTLKGAGDTGDAKCAEYLGRIVGASGANPALIVSNLDTIENLQLSLGDGARVVYPTDESGSIGTGNSLPDSYPLISANTNNNMLVSGKEQDDIKYTWVNVMSDDESHFEYAARIYMGFQIPYLVNEFETYQKGWTTNPDIINITEGDHPFYNKWKIGLPQGIRGNAASGLRTAYPKDFINTAVDSSTAIPNEYLYDFDTIFNINSSGVSSFSIPQTEQDIINATPTILRDKNPAGQEEPILVYDYTIYNKTEGGTDPSKTTLTFFLGYYKQIKELKLDEETGVINIVYGSAAGETQEFLNTDSPLNWITSVSIDDEGLLSIESNNGKIDTQTQLPYPTQVGVSSSNGSIAVTLAGRDDPLILKDATNSSTNPPNFALNYVRRINMNDDTKALIARYFINDETEILNGGFGLNYITAVVIDEYNHLLVFFASSQYRPEDIEDRDTGTTAETLPQGGYRISYNGHNFRNGFAYAAKVNETQLVIDESDFWLDLGLVHTKEHGIRIVDKVNYIDNCPIPTATIESYNRDQFIELILNPEYWDAAETIKNPYYNGHIGHYEKNAVGNWELVQLANDYGEPYWGTFIGAPDIDNGTAYYYDYNNSSWACIGDWGESSSIDIKIDTNQTGEPELSQYGVRLLSYNSNGNAETSLPDFWAGSLM